MPDRDIRCRSCDCYLGVIRDGNLRNDLVYLCEKCWLKLREHKPRKTSVNDDGTVDYLRKMFRM